MRVIRTTGIVALGGALALAALASAHVVKYPTKSLSVQYSPGDDPAFFSGKVEAKKRACRANRRVVVHSDVPGVDAEVGSDRTSSDGSFKLVAPGVAAGTYYADADRKTLKLTVDHRHICRAVRSPSIQAGS
jgi:hypothetical protein